MSESAYVVAFAIYFGAMGLLNYTMKKRNLVGGIHKSEKKLGAAVSALSLQINDIGTWIIAVVPCICYGSVAGVKAGIYVSAGLVLGYFLSCSLISERLRMYSEITGVKSVPSYLSRRFGDKRGIFRFSAAVIEVLLILGFVSYMLNFASNMLFAVFGCSRSTALIVCVIIVLGLAAFGGFMNAPYGDTLQCILILGGLAALVLWLYGSMNLAQSSAFFGNLSELTEILPGFKTTETDISVFATFMCLGWFVYCIGSPRLLSEFLNMKKRRIPARARVVSGIWSGLSLLCALLVGCLVSYILPDISSSEVVIRSVMSEKYIFVRCVILVAVFGVISTVLKSEILLASETFAEDIFPFVSRKFDDKELRYIKLVGALFFTFISALLAGGINGNVFDTLSFSVTGLCAAFGPVVLFSLYSKKLTLCGGIVSMISGLVGAFFFSYVFTSNLGSGFNIYAVFPSFALSAAVLFGVSLIDGKKTSSSVNKEFDRVKAVVNCHGNYRMK